VNIPRPPDVSKFSEWKVFATEAGTLLAWAGANKGLMLVFGVWILCTVFWTRISSCFQRRFA
jgi:hypothetical protein